MYAKGGGKEMTIGQRIKTRRKQLKISADELAKRLGKDRSTIYRYEKGDIESMPWDILKPIADALDTTIAYIMGWNEEQPDLTEEKEKPTVNDDGLSDDMKIFMEFARKVPEHKLPLALRLLKTILEEDE